MMPFAADRTHVDLSETRTIKASGGLHVYGIIVTNITGSTDSVTFEDASGNDIMIVRLATNTTQVINIPWLADNGLVVFAGTPAAGMTVTIFHNNIQGGA